MADTSKISWGIFLPHYHLAPKLINIPKHLFLSTIITSRDQLNLTQMFIFNLF